jgi:hypothetical protein
VSRPEPPPDPIRFEFTHIIRLELDPDLVELIHDFLFLDPSDTPDPAGPSDDAAPAPPGGADA